MPAATELPFAWQLQRSRRRTLAIRVRAGVVEVRAPLRAPQAWIEACVVQKAAWIERRLQEQARQADERLRIADGCRLPLLGGETTLRFVAAGRYRAVQQGDTLHLHGRLCPEQAGLPLLKRWLADEARAYISPRAETLAERLGLRPRLASIGYRYTRSQWGRCTARGAVQFNPLILLAPPAVVDYLIAHEICHLRHLDHSAAYWALVASVCPAHTELRQWLRRHEHRLRL